LNAVQRDSKKYIIIMTIKGNLQTLELANILQLLCNDQKTGVLTLTDGVSEVKVNILEGSIIFATSSQKKFRLGYLLRNDGIISDDQAKECFEKSQQLGEVIGKVMVTEGLINQEMLDKYSLQQVENILYDLFFWSEGEFEYKDVTHDLKGMKIVPLNVMNLLLEASRRIDEMSVLKKQIPNENMVYQISQKIDEIGDVILNINEWRILSFINGTRSLGQVVEASGFDEFSVYKIIYSLTSYGLLKALSPGADNLGDKSSGYSAIVEFYYEVLQIIHAELENG